MNCPRCDHDIKSPDVLCAECGFNGDTAVLQRLTNLNYLLQEIPTWDMPTNLTHSLVEKYQARQRQTQVALGLRQPPPNAAEAHDLRLELLKRQTLLQALRFWANQGWISHDTSDEWHNWLGAEMATITDRLRDTPADPPVSGNKALIQQWEQKRYLQANLHRLAEAGQLSAMGAETVGQRLEIELERLEVQLGLRQPPTVIVGESQTTAVSPPLDTPAPPPATPPKAPRRQREPITWDRVWETLLSERTLNAILFMGVVLLFGAGVSWVVWNWNTFPPLIQITFLGSFTTLFYALGWYVGGRMKLRESGIALTAVGSLLVPLDFAVYYLSGGFPAGSWPAIWLIASAVCLVAYLVTAVQLQAEFFGYLVAGAVTSLAMAALNHLGVEMSGWQTAVTGVACALALYAELAPWLPQPARLFTRPFRQMAVITAVPALLIGLGWGFTTRQYSIPYHTALAISWWLGGLAILLTVRPMRSRSLAWIAALSFPVAAWLTGRVITSAGELPVAWQAVGWSLLAPVYLSLAWWLSRWADDLHDAYRQTAVSVGWLMVLVAALWSLTFAPAIPPVHLLLALTLLLTAWLRQDAQLVWLISLFLLSSSGAWQGNRVTTPTELALPWGLLSILHMVVALNLSQPAFAAPVLGAAVMIAGLAVLPPLLLNDRPLLIYALGNWIGITGWLAYLSTAGANQTPGLSRLLATRWLGKVGPALFHWLVAPSLVAWVWLVGTNGREATGELALVLAGLAWGLVRGGMWLRQRQWEYGRPWQTAAHLANLLALGIILLEYVAPWDAPTLLLVATFYFAAVWWLHNPRWFYVGGLLLPIAGMATINRLGISRDFDQPMVAGLVLAYILAAARLEAAFDQPRSHLEPLYRTALLLLPFVFLSTLPGIFADDLGTAWQTAVTQLLLAAALALYAWQVDNSRWAHLGIWLGALGGGVLVEQYSRGTGRSAVYAALLAVVLVLAERRLYALSHQPKGEAFFRRAWRLYRRPLLVAGWSISVFAIGWAVGRNVFLLGGRTREFWAVVSLGMVTGLYAVAAYLFRRPRFIWLAAALAIVPWTLTTHLLFGPVAEWYSVSWLVLSLVLLAVAARLAHFLELGSWSWPPAVVAHSLTLYALLWAVLDPAAASVTYGLAVLFYLGAVWLDWRFRPHDQAMARFLYPAALLLPTWAVYVWLWQRPQAELTEIGLLLLTFAWPFLLAGRRVARWEAAYRWPLYLLAYGTAVTATLLVMPDRPALIGVLLFDVALAGLSAWMFAQPLWVYPAALLLPLAVQQIWLELVPGYFGEFNWQLGWLFVSLGLAYILLARWLTQHKWAAYAWPLLLVMGLLFVWGMDLSVGQAGRMLVGYGGVALGWGLTAVWWGWPLLWWLAVGTAVVPYWCAVSLLELDLAYYGLAAWPGILLMLALAYWLDEQWGYAPSGDGLKRAEPFPWSRPLAWIGAVWQRVSRWWALPLYVVGFGGVVLSPLLVLLHMAATLAFESGIQPMGEGWLVCVLALGTAVYFWGLSRFRLRGWLLLAWFWLELTAGAIIWWSGLAHEPSQVALAFLPMTALTLFAAVLVQTVRQEDAPLVKVDGRWQVRFGGWARPLYLLLWLNLAIGELLTLDMQASSAPATLVQAIMVGIIASVWQWPVLVYGALFGGLAALSQSMVWSGASSAAWPTAWAVLAAVYGLVGYALQRIRPEMKMWPWVEAWQRALRYSGGIISGLALAVLIDKGLPVLDLFMQALVRRPLLTWPETVLVTMVVRTLAVLGLFYLVASLAEKWPRFSYLALWLLLTSWSVWLLLLAGSRELQFYALPSGLYLLLVGWLEHSRGSQAVARWIDRAGLLLLLGSSFWQSLGQWGGGYALLMIVEGLLIAWLGSWRRLRRLLYGGVVGVVTAVAGQLIEPLMELNSLALLLLGALLVALGIGLERRLEKVRHLSQEWRTRLESWE